VALSSGDILSDRYRLLERLGRGGMADVWSASDLSTGAEVAVKIMQPRAARDPELVERMHREARTAGAIHSPFVCELLGSGSVGGRPFLVFERLRGESLAALLARETSLPFSEVGGVVDNVLEGLSAAHGAGVIHRDLSLANVFLEDIGGRRRRARIIDFGVSKDTGESTLTRANALIGTYHFMAPEQAKGARDVDERADIYAVGVIAFRALAGRLPFESTNPTAVLALKANREPPTLGEVTHEVWPADLERFLQTMLARRREQRFPSAFSALLAWRVIVNKTTLARERGARASQSPESPPKQEDTRTETMTVAGPPRPPRPSTSRRK